MLLGALHIKLCSVAWIKEILQILRHHPNTSLWASARSFIPPQPAVVRISSNFPPLSFQTSFMVDQFGMLRRSDDTSLDAKLLSTASFLYLSVEHLYQCLHYCLTILHLMVTVVRDFCNQSISSLKFLLLQLWAVISPYSCLAFTVHILNEPR